MAEPAGRISGLVPEDAVEVAQVGIADSSGDFVNGRIAVQELGDGILDAQIDDVLPERHPGIAGDDPVERVRMVMKLSSQRLIGQRLPVMTGDIAQDLQPVAAFLTFALLDDAGQPGDQDLHLAIQQQVPA